MFDTIQRTHLVTGEWAYTLNKLICYGIVDVQTNSELLFTVLDMLSALIHSTLVSDSADSVENSKRAYHTLIKKIKVLVSHNTVTFDLTVLAISLLVLESFTLVVISQP